MLLLSTVLLYLEKKSVLSSAVVIDSGFVHISPFEPQAMGLGAAFVYVPHFYQAF